MHRLLLAAAAASILFASCIQLGLNFRNKTPRRAAKVPLFSLRDSLLGYNNLYRSGFDVKHYLINLNIDPRKEHISGFVATRFEMLTDEQIIQLDLEPLLTVDSVVSGSARLEFSRKHTALFVKLAPGKTMQTVTVFYHGKPRSAKRPPWDGGLVWKKDRDGNPFAGVACEGEGAGLWLPVKAWLGDEPDSVTCVFTAPVDLTVVSNGALVKVTENGPRRAFHWQTSYPVNPYNITFYLGKYVHITGDYRSAGGDKVPLSYYVLGRSEKNARRHFSQVPRILNCFESVFGTYPWPRDGYRLVESPYAGMEHQTAIAYGNGYKNDLFKETDYIILHETAHEWWGNSVSVSDFSDVWIHEGIATYAESLYMERYYNYPVYLWYMRYLSGRVTNRKPLVGPRGVYYWDYRDPDVYVKGAAMLHTLRNNIANDSLFFDIMRHFYDRHKYSIANTGDFETLVQSKAGDEALRLVRHFLHRRESPLLEWWYDVSEGKPCIRYRLKRADPGLGLRIRARHGGHEFEFMAEETEGVSLLPGPPGSALNLNSRNSYLELRKVRRPR